MNRASGHSDDEVAHRLHMTTCNASILKVPKLPIPTYNLTTAYIAQPTYQCHL
jgi:hypothetical protein